MSGYLSFVQSVVDGMRKAEDVSVRDFKVRACVGREDKVLLFSPHPDDECIIGLLPLRLQHECEYQVVNVPMTFGSKDERKAGRLAELEDACGYLGWENYRAREDLENLTVEDVKQTLLKFEPSVIVFPHDADWNSRHIEVHHTVMKALGEMPKEFQCLVVESEFWGAMDDPNAHVEGSAEQLSELMAATSLHVEEVARNAYHLRLPAWMQDNVRRGAELVGGQGEEAPDFDFSTLYKIQVWRDGGLEALYDGGRVFACGVDELKQIVEWK
jgi:N-acetylglucosamine malate deacetylase 1